jgi:hypothetical protein
MDNVSNFAHSVAIEVDGKRLPIYSHNGHYYITGQPGKKYTIAVNCFNSKRVEVVESIDGRDVLKDQPANLSNSGMVIQGMWLNRGWRINDNEIREFEFGNVEGSIAAQAGGSTSNVGVIGVAIFAEKESVNYWRYDRGTYYGRIESKTLTSSFSAGDQLRGFVPASAAPDLGTHMGEKREDKVGHTEFKRASSIPSFQVEIQYRSREWLTANGIGIEPSALPSAFPGSETGYEKYVR